MDMKTVLVLFFYSQLVPFSYQEIIQLSVNPVKPVNERDALVLKCISRPGYTSYQWVLNDQPVVSTSDEGVTYDFHGKDSAVYLVEIFENRAGNTVFKLTITNASRFDNGRWSCILESSSGSPERDEDRIIAEVRYQPHSRFPECNLDRQSGYAMCTTELGNPRVELTWVDTGDEGRTIRGQNEDTDNLMFRSQVEAFSLSPPVENDEAIECRIALGEETRKCSLTKAEIYANISLVLVQDGDTDVFRCSVYPALFRPNLMWHWSSSKATVGTESDDGLNATVLSLENVDKSSTDTVIQCTLVWGVFNHTFRVIHIPADTPTTVFLPISSAPTPHVAGQSEATGAAPQNVEETTAVGRSTATHSEDDSTDTPSVLSSRDNKQRTLTPMNGKGAAVPSEDSSANVVVLVIFIIIAFAVIVPLVVFIVAIIYICFRKTDPPPAVI